MIMKCMKLMPMLLALMVSAALGTSFAATFSDSDVIPVFNSTTNQWTWTHVLDNNEFSPDLASGDTIQVTDALLSIQMDYQRFGTGSIKLFEVSASGDNQLLATYVADGHADVVNNFVWDIDLDTVLASLNDRYFAVTLALQADKGTIKNIDFSTLSGNAIVTDPPPVLPPDPPPTAPVQAPEPGTFLLLGSGLMGLAFFGSKRMKKSDGKEV